MPYGTSALVCWGLMIVITCVTALAAVLLVMRVIREIAMTAIAKSESKDLPRVLRELAPVIRAIGSPLARLAPHVPSQPRLLARMHGCRREQDDGIVNEEPGS